VAAPVLRDLSVPTPAALSRARVGIAMVVAAGLGAVFVKPWVGVLLAIVVFVASRNGRARLALRLAPGVIVVALAFGLAAAQQLNRYPQRFEWPTFFDWARYPTWIAVAFLAAEAVLSLASAQTQPGEPETHAVS
jgi:hypothetical protein